MRTVALGLQRRDGVDCWRAFVRNACSSPSFSDRYRGMSLDALILLENPSAEELTVLRACLSYTRGPLYDMTVVPPGEYNKQLICNLVKRPQEE